MTERPPPYHPHLWVPNDPADEAEICTLCGAFLTPDNSGEDCPESFPEIAADPPEEVPLPDQAEPADGWDDEQRCEVMPPP
jgi:hypothetical protein